MWCSYHARTSPYRGRGPTAIAHGFGAAAVWQAGASDVMLGYDSRPWAERSHRPSRRDRASQYKIGFVNDRSRVSLTSYEYHITSQRKAGPSTAFAYHARATASSLAPYSY